MHAMKFPGVKRIVYSTCSVYSVENEDVVSAAFNDSEQQGSFRIKEALPNWPHRLSNPKYAWSDMCVVADYENDQTDGFFVAVLEKIKVKSKTKSNEEDTYLLLGSK
jgi:putative methyltransferase